MMGEIGVGERGYWRRGHDDISGCIEKNKRMENRGALVRAAGKGMTKL